MQAVGQHMGLGVLQGTSLPSYQSEPSRSSKGITSAMCPDVPARACPPVAGGPSFSGHVLQHGRRENRKGTRAFSPPARAWRHEFARTGTGAGRSASFGRG